MEWHLITPEFPPALGGVSDYSCQVALGLAAEGDRVEVWAPGQAGDRPPLVTHWLPGGFTPANLRRMGKEWNGRPGGRRLLVQWVPHGFGYRSMNVPLCLWLWVRARWRRDNVYLMVHEPFLAFGHGSFKQQIVAAVHRVMTVLLLHAASQVWVSIPAWAAALRPFALGRNLAMEWLPVPSNIERVEDPAAVRQLRQRYLGGGRHLVGHFGTYGRAVTLLLEARIERLMRGDAAIRFLLIGQGSEVFRDRHPQYAPFVEATGPLAAPEISRHLQACDLMIQPYPDGVSSRRGSAMAGLSHGRPIVTTSGHLSEPFWQSAGALVLVPVEDADAFTRETLALLGDGERRERLGAAGARYYEEHFALGRIVDTLKGRG